MILKMRSSKIIIGLLLISLLASFHSKAIAKNDTLVVISTSYGVIKLMLYEDTPIHRHNFIKLAKTGFYDSLLFHRIISGFMIQGGDPDSRRASSSEILGNGDIGYKLPQEILNNHFHKKGCLAAARQPDDVNQDRASSACQFYIVQGKKYSELDIVTVESRLANQLKQSITLRYLGRPENAALKTRFLAHQQARNKDSLDAIIKVIQPFIEGDLKTQKPHVFSAEEKHVYANFGGSPHLDGGYTIFGEVVEGIEIIDKLAEVEVNGNNRPLMDIRMKVTLEIVNK